MSADVWPVESIPNSDLLYYRIHRNSFDETGQEIAPGHFRPRERPGSDADQPGMSTDWSRYSSPTESRDRARRPTDNLIVALPVGEVRRIEELSVVHSPIQNDPHLADNRAHTDVFGVLRDLEIRDRLAKLAVVVLPLNQP